MKTVEETRDLKNKTKNYKKRIKEEKAGARVWREWDNNDFYQRDRDREGDRNRYREQY